MTNEAVYDVRMHCILPVSQVLDACPVLPDTPRLVLAAAGQLLGVDGVIPPHLDRGGWQRGERIMGWLAPAIAGTLVGAVPPAAPELWLQVRCGRICLTLSRVCQCCVAVMMSTYCSSGILVQVQHA